MTRVGTTAKAHPQIKNIYITRCIYVKKIMNFMKSLLLIWFLKKFLDI